MIESHVSRNKFSNIIMNDKEMHNFHFFIIVTLSHVHACTCVCMRVHACAVTVHTVTVQWLKAQYLGETVLFSIQAFKPPQFKMGILNLFRNNECWEENFDEIVK